MSMHLGVFVHCRSSSWTLHDTVSQLFTLTLRGMEGFRGTLHSPTTSA